MIKDIYKFLHDNYNYKEKWNFVHYFVYTLTFGLGISSIVVFILTAIATGVCIGSKVQAWIICAAVAAVSGILAMLCWSLLAWINRE